MGLDVTAYSNLHAVGRHTDGWCEEEEHVRAFAYDSFPVSFRGIPVLGNSVYPNAQFLEGGCYETTDKTEACVRVGGRQRPDLVPLKGGTYEPVSRPRAPRSSSASWRSR